MMGVASIPAHVPRAVIVGLDHMNGLQAARLLAARDVPVVGVAQDRGHAGCRTRVCERIVLAEGGDDQGVLSALRRLGPTLAGGGVLVPSTDSHVRTVSRHRDELRTWFAVPLPAPEVVELCMDKVRFYAWAESHGFRVPRSVTLDGPGDVDRAVAQLEFPCVLKPPLSATRAWEEHSPLKAYVLEDARALRVAHERLRSLSDVLIVQEWIPGPVSSLYSVNAHVGPGGAPVATFVARKLRQWPVDTGESSLGEECRNDEVLAIATRLWRTLEYEGLAYLEVKQHALTGEHVIIEPNVGRPTGRSAIAEAGGVELLLAHICAATGRPLPSALEQQYGYAKWMHLRHDLQSALVSWRRGDLTVREWAHSVRGRKAFALLSLSDPGPFLADLGRAVRLGLSTKERRARDYESARAAVTGGEVA